MADINDLIASVSSKNPVEFGAAFDDIMRQRTLAAIEDRRVELARAIYGGEEDDVESEDEVDVESEGTDEDEFEGDDDDLDIDIDLEDFDEIDLDDIELDDLEDEGIEDGEES